MQCEETNGQDMVRQRIEGGGGDGKVGGDMVGGKGGQD